MSRHTFLGLDLTSPRNLRLGSLVLVLVAIDQINDPLLQATLGEEIVYWLVRNLVLVVGLWSADALVARFLQGSLGKPEWLKPVLLVSVVGLLPLALAETLIEPLLPMRPEFVDDDLPLSLALISEYATIVSIVFPIHMLLWLIIERKTHAPANVAEDEAQTVPNFLQRSSVTRAGDVLALEAEEHYVRIHTNNGSEMVYCRFSDAAAEMPAGLGLQVHRSWWVAESAVRRAKRGSRRWQLDLVNEVAVPISDSFVKSVRDQGWLKRKRVSQ